MATLAINHARAMPAAQVRFRGRMTTLMESAAQRIGAIVVRESVEDVVPVENARRVAAEATDVIQQLFLGDGGREPVRGDGYPRSAYARVLLEEVGRATYDIVSAHEQYLRRVLPAEVRLWMQRAVPVQAMRPRDGMLREISAEELRRRFPDLTADQARRAAESRLFDPNKLAEYEKAHTWVDPRGYRLSDRIWRVDQRTRDKLDALLIDAIAEGRGATYIARLVEQYLIPGRAKVRTNKPYGTDGSFDAMRLGRTEIAHAANEAAYIAAYQNPYVGAIEIMRSANGDATCPICPQHATIGMSGERLRPAYPIDSANIPPFHPHCMCRVQTVARESIGAVEDDLRALVQMSRETNLVPVMNPTDINGFMRQLLGEILWNITRQVLPAQPLLL